MSRPVCLRCKRPESHCLCALIPALLPRTRVVVLQHPSEARHALAEVVKRAPKMDKDQIIVMNLCGRGDKDIFTVGKILGMGL